MLEKCTAEQFTSLMEVREVSSIDRLGGVHGIASSLQTDLVLGILDITNIERRQEIFGKNIPAYSYTWYILRLFFETFFDLITLILLALAIISLVFIIIFPCPNDSLGWVDSASLSVAVLLEALIRLIINYRQKSVFNTLYQLKYDIIVSVVRNGERKNMSSTELVVGDLLYIEAGNLIPADGIFVDGRNLTIDESNFTGEKMPKQIDHEQPFIFSGSTVETGDGHMLVLAVGVNTQNGAFFAEMTKKRKKKDLTPLETKLNYLSKLISYIGIAGFSCTFIVLLIKWSEEISLLKWNHIFLNVFMKKFIVSFTILVCSAPRSLPFALAITFSHSMARMIKDKNLMRQLGACETMSIVSNICIGKTGTLTTNKMKVERFFFCLHDYDQNENPPMEKSIKDIFGIGISVNLKENVTTNDEGVLECSGKSAEFALYQYVESMGFNVEEIRRGNPTVALFGFDSNRKRMTTVIKDITDPNSFLICSKGAPEVMLDYVSCYVSDKDGSVQKMTEEITNIVKQQLSDYSQKMLHSLLIAYRKGGICDSHETAENDLVMIGILALSDSIRCPEVQNNVAECKKAGVIIRLITGDDIETSKVIANQCGILTEEGIVMSGNEFRTMPKMELLDKLPRLQVLARSTPMDKLRLVRILKEVGEVVAITGSNNDDALALKMAHIGLSMGICGAERVKEASDICILDDSFASITMAVKWGRCISDNVRKILQFQLTINVVTVIVSFFGACIWRESPFKAMQLLWVNLIMDSLGCLALATDKPRGYLLEQQPCGQSMRFLTGIVLMNIAGQLFYQILVMLIVLVLGEKIWTDITPHSLQHSTLIFNVHVFCQIFNMINSRIVARTQKLFDGILSNYVFIIIFIFIIFIQVIIVQFGGRVFETSRLSWVHWLSCVAIGMFSLAFGTLSRMIKIKETSSEEIEQKRMNFYEALKENLRGMSVTEQWEAEAKQAKKELKNLWRKNKNIKKNGDEEEEDEEDGENRENRENREGEEDEEDEEDENEDPSTVISHKCENNDDDEEISQVSESGLCL